MGAQVSFWGKNVRTSFTLGQKCAPKFQFGAMFVRTFFNYCLLFGHPLFRPIPAFHFWETVGWAVLCMLCMLSLENIDC